MANRYYRGPVSDHFDGERFFHPGLATTDKSLRELLRWRFQGTASRWPKAVPAREGIRPSERVAGLAITHIGHASYLVQAEGRNLLLDPVWSERASPFSRIGPRRHNPPAIRFEDLPPIDAVLLTHNHYDHMDLPTIRRLWSSHQPAIYAPLGNDAVVRAAAPEVAVQTCDWWQSFPLPAGMRLTLVPAYHWSSRSLRDRRMALWGGFVLQTANGTLYCAGDTAYRDGVLFREIAKRFGPPEVAVLPIGAYAPRWFMQTQHADPHEALQIAEDCGAVQMLGVHWGTFQLTDEPFHEPADRLAEAVRNKGLDPERFRAMQPGDVWLR